MQMRSEFVDHVNAMIRAYDRNVRRGYCCCWSHNESQRYLLLLEPKLSRQTIVLWSTAKFYLIAWRILHSSHFFRKKHNVSPAWATQISHSLPLWMRMGENGNCMSCQQKSRSYTIKYAYGNLSNVNSKRHLAIASTQIFMNVKQSGKHAIISAVAP